MRRQVWLAVGAGSALLFTALFLAMTASAAKTVSTGTKNGSCYDDNEATLSEGDTSATLHKVKVNSSFEIEPGGDEGQTELPGTVKAEMWFTVIEDVSLKGHASVDFRIIDEHGDVKKGHFESRCIQEASTEPDGENCEDECVEATDQFEAEFEGTVKGLPFAGQGKQPAVATLTGYRDDEGQIVLHFGVEQGFTCNETGGEFGSENSDDPGGEGDLSADDTDSGRWGLPDGFDADSEDPCPDVSG